MQQNTMCHSKSKAFTLIELLVVVAIIALLVAILVPTLENARRQAQVVVCSSNLHQIGVGLMVYVTQWDNQYPPPSSISVRIIYTDEVPVRDNRDALVDIAGGHGSGKGLYFCPLWQWERPEDSPFENEYSDDFYYWGPAANRHSVGYNMFFLIYEPVFSWDWSYSGNPRDEGPYQPGESNAAIVADANVAYSGSDWEDPEYPAHVGPDGRHAETNVLYGDGHAETHYELKNFVYRSHANTRYPY